MGNVRFDGVTKRFRDGSDEVVAVNDLNMEIKDGELLVIVGPSGCGKTTTLRMIAGLETITEGEIYLNDSPMSGRKPQERDLAMVFQSYALYPHMTVRENMSFGLEQSTDLPSDEIASRVEEIGEMLDIPELLDRHPGDLSGGQQQRVALGRAIIRDPEVFLMDEPLSNLDAKLRAQMRTELQRLQEDLDTTTVYVTHDQTEAMTMGDRIAILNDGELQQIGTPMECYDRPANRFVAGFIGEPQMNFFEIEVAGGRLHGTKIDHQLDEDIAAKLDDGPVTLGIRPEDVSVTEPDGPAIAVDTTVDVIEPLGSENNVYFRIEEPDEAGLVDAGKDFVGVIGEEEPIDGPQTTVYFPEDLVHFFDAETGDALHNQTREAVDQQAAWPT